MGFAETGLSIEGGCEDGRDGAENFPVDRHDLGSPSDGNVHNSLEKMPMQSVSFLELRPMRISIGWGLSKIPCWKDRGRSPESRNTTRRLRRGRTRRDVFRDIIYIDEPTHAR